MRLFSDQIIRTAAARPTLFGPQAHGELVKVFGWYDNERGRTSRLLDLTEYVAARLPRR